MLEESKKVREHIIEITEPKLRRVGGGREEKILEKCGGQYWGKSSYVTELLLGRRPEYLCRSLHLSDFKTVSRPQTASS